MPYAPLHLHTTYSLLDGLIKIKDLMPFLKQNGFTHAAITDHGNLFGAVEWVQTAQKHGITPLIGVEQYICSDMKDRTHRRQYHAILIAYTNKGWENLRFLNSMAHMEGFYYYPRLDLDMIRQYREGILCLSACLGGEVAQAFRDGGYARMRDVALRYKNSFDQNAFLLEVQPNGLREQEELNRALSQLGHELDISLVATGDCHYLYQSDARAQDVLMAINTRAKVGDQDRLTHGEMQRLYVMTEEEMRWYFAQHGLEQAVDNASIVAGWSTLKLDLGKPKLPKFPVPDGIDPISYFQRQCEQGLERRMSENPYMRNNEDKYLSRLAHEMGVIVRMDFPGYFLIVAEFVGWARDQGIPTGAGRGSGAGSLIAYALRITDIDPIKYGLLFERFLNPERVSMPDFDVDFCERRRGEVIAHLKERYGSQSVGKIITFGKLMGKSAIQNVAKTMGMEHRQAVELTKGTPTIVDGHPPTVKWILENGTAMRERKAEDPAVAEIADLALSVEGAIKTRGVHPSGIVISQGPLWETVPVVEDRNNPGEMVVQTGMNETEAAGLIKFDVLGLRTMTMLHLCEVFSGASMKDIPMDDKGTYALIARGDTTGVFQMGGDGIRRMLRDMAPTQFEHLSAAIALYRPGPLEGGMVKSYIDRMHGREPIEYLHPALEEATKDTFGVLLYQEQIMSVCRILAGYSLGQADIVRRVMGKKKREEVDKERARFMAAASDAGQCSPEQAKDIWDLCEKFSGYGFNVAHSVGYAMLSYYTAWYKHNHKAAFYAAYASTEQGDRARLAKILHEARRDHVQVMPPDVNSAAHDFAPAGQTAIRASLRMLKGVGPAMVDKILAGRQEGNYRDLWDLAQRGHVPPKTLETLIKAGACDAIIPEGKTGPDRAGALATAPNANKKTKQRSLFADGPMWAKARPMSRKDMLTGEKEATGLYLSGHPLDDAFRPEGSCHVASLNEIEDGEEGTLRVLVSSYEERQTRNGQGMASCVFEDETGDCEIVAFPREWSKVKDTIREAFRSDQILIVGVTVNSEEQETDEGTTKVMKLFLRSAMPMTWDEQTVPVQDGKAPTVSLIVTVPEDRADPEELSVLLDRIRACPGAFPVKVRLGKDVVDLDMTAGDRALQDLPSYGYGVRKG